MQPALAPAPHPIQNPSQDNAADLRLREHLLNQVSAPQTGSARSIDNMRPSSSASPQDQNIDPAIATSVMNMGMSNESGGEDSQLDGSGRKGQRRELSTSKRAAQNRAAQRAFRQRKEGYIKKLEEQVRDVHALEDNCKAMQAENYQLRDYIINLQSRLIESQGEIPQPPSNIDLPNPRLDLSQQHQRPPQQASGSGSGGSSSIPAPSSLSQLQASAAEASAAVADLAANSAAQQSSVEDATYAGTNGFPSSKRVKGEPSSSGADGSPGAADKAIDANGTTRMSL
ncbi:MAG: hypothetical protein M1825_002185 [Sarcosagium campestre]|nr:MAG: hypothetical protein M1825_002185 [Sarcosagium campestre]